MSETMNLQSNVVALAARGQDRTTKAAGALDAVADYAKRIAKANNLEDVGRELLLLLDGLRDLVHVEVHGADNGATTALRSVLYGSRASNVAFIRRKSARVAARVAATRQEHVTTLADRDGPPIHAIGIPVSLAVRFYGVVTLTSHDPFDDDKSMLRALCAIAAAVLDRVDEAKTRRVLMEIVERSGEAVSLYDASGTILFTNTAYHRIFTTYPEADRLVGMTHEDLYRLDLAAGIIDDPVALSEPERYLAERIKVFRELEGDAREVQTVGDRTYLYTRSRLATGETFSRRIDITEMEAAKQRLHASQRRIEEIAFVDPITGLANRMRFREAVEALIERAPEDFTVLLVNLDHFRAVNDGLGDAAGDALLAAVGQRLAGSGGAFDLVARLGGDEFAVLHRSASGEPHDAIRRLRAIFAEDFVLEGRRLPIRASIGVASHPGDGATVDALLHNAGLALSRAKAGGRGCVQWFERDMEAALADRRMLALDLKEAIALRQLDVHYQPLVHSSSGLTEGFEALVRWRHPVRGAVSPAEFIPIAEASGLIVEIGNFVLERAIATARGWPKSVSVAVNLSARQLAASDLVDLVLGAAGEDFDLTRLELEITETVLLGNNPQVVENLNRLRALGVGISLDDFGTGFSSLSYLLSFPFTKIKIDRSFIADVIDRREAFAIVKSVIDLGGHLGMKTTAEGVENADQAKCLRELGCGQLQGYMIAKPAPSAAVDRWLAAETAHRSA